MDKVGKEKQTENWRLSSDVFHPHPDVCFFLHSFLGADISHLRTLQGIWTNGFVISPFLPLLRCSFLPFAMNSFIWTCPPPFFSCSLCTLLESYYHCNHPGFGRYVFPLSFSLLFNILSSLFSSLSHFLCNSQTHSHSLKNHLRGLNSSTIMHSELLSNTATVFFSHNSQSFSSRSIKKWGDVLWEKEKTDLQSNQIKTLHFTSFSPSFSFLSPLQKTLR